ncbi:hypothetical protein HOV03_gp94 [Gordonia phage Asapag]|uniref:Uncharacterized protein n=1 Tax=Gordonia phage Asapag TaxID=2507862 RepID=A0A410TDZ3_9CAUD|nr:hypothetical protein HOV03_gp94 [Gordonia phage Asapag]QAU07233.1 hypothetical protein SEA_ASAPAG_94 [Gordonia phage Asapag]
MTDTDAEWEYVQLYPGLANALTQLMCDNHEGHLLFSDRYSMADAILADGWRRLPQGVPEPCPQCGDPWCIRCFEGEDLDEMKHMAAQRDAALKRASELEGQLEQAKQFGIGEWRATAWAYEQACATIERQRARADEAERRLAAIEGTEQ